MGGLPERLTQALKHRHRWSSRMRNNIPKLYAVVPKAELEARAPCARVHMHMRRAVLITQQDYQ